jgi:uncharacterized protein (DUF58 family)
MKKLLDLTYAIEPKLVEPDYSGALAHFASLQKGRCLVVVFTDLIDATGSRALLQGLSSLSPRHLPVCVTLLDRRVREIANGELIFSPKQTTRNLEQMFRKAVATDLIVQRNVALSVLQRQGCLVIDAPPEELTSKLIDQYLKVKMRARL